MYGGTGGRANWALVLGVVGLLAATPALSADLGGDCCADLEERIAELEATTARNGNRKVSLTLSGSVNEALLFWDDGRERNVYEGTNDAARSRFRLQGDAKINKEWSVGYLIEVGIRTNRLNRTDQFHPHGITTDPNDALGYELADGLDVRHSAWFIQSTELGRLWVGKTDQATERITEITTANTNNFLKHYGRWNGSFVLRLKSTGNYAIGAPGTQVFGTTTTNSNFRTWGNLLPQSGFTGEGVPGEGDRFNVVKWDSPEFHGFVASAAWGEDDFWDVALRYAGEHHGFKIVGGIGYSDWSGVGSLNTRGCSIDVSAPASPPPPGQFTTGKSSCSQLGLSGSIMHLDTGLFATGGYGIKWDDERSAAFNGMTDVLDPGKVDDTDNFYFVNAGIEQKFKSLGLDQLGRTTIYGEWEHYDTGAIISGNGQTATGRPRSFTAGSGVPNVGGAASQFGSGADIDVFGLGINQNIEKASIDLYLAYRYAEAELFVSDNGAKNGPGAGKIEFEPIQMLMSGAVIKF